MYAARMNILNTKLIYAVLLASVAAMAFIWMITPLLKELSYQGLNLTIKPIWFLGKSRDAHSKKWWDRARFYNYRRAYTGAHRGVHW